MNTKFLEVESAKVDNGTITMRFYHKCINVTTAEYRDAINPHYIPVKGEGAEYLVTVTGWRVFFSHEKYNGSVYHEYGRKPEGTINIQTYNKDIVNWLWYLGKHQKASYHEILAIKKRCRL